MAAVGEKMQAPPGLPNCLDLKESQRADCFLASTTDRAGYVVYSNYRGCLNSWLAVPGFMLLPTWGLASKSVVSSRCRRCSCGACQAIQLAIMWKENMCQQQVCVGKRHC